MNSTRSHPRAARFAVAVLLLGSVLWASPTSAIEMPTPVSVTVEFVDNACVDNTYVQPAMVAPDVPGTSHSITGMVAPGETVEVTYTALQGFVIEGQSTFTHTFPTEPASLTDCQVDQPDPLVRGRSTTRTNCDGVDRREWDVVTGYVWDGSEWVLGEPEIRNDTGWVFIRDLTEREQKQLGCFRSGGDDGTGPGDVSAGGGPANPSVDVAPAQQAPPTVHSVPTAVDAGLSDPVVTSAVPLWLAPLLGGVLMLALGAFTRLKALGQQTWPVGKRPSENSPTKGGPSVTGS